MRIRKLNNLLNYYKLINPQIGLFIAPCLFLLSSTTATTLPSKTGKESLTDAVTRTFSRKDDGQTAPPRLHFLRLVVSRKRFELSGKGHKYQTVWFVFNVDQTGFYCANLAYSCRSDSKDIIATTILKYSTKIM